MDKSQKFFTCALIFTAQLAQAAIVADGPWTGKDWYDYESNIGVENGVPYSDDPDMQNVLTAPLSLDGPLDAYLDMKNVQLVQSIFSESDWDVAFSYRNPIYTYDNFLKAVAKFPKFCNDNNIPGNTMEETCRRELAAMFAHWGQETGLRQPPESEFWKQGLYYVEEITKSDYKSWEWGNNDKWPNQAGV